MVHVFSVKHLSCTQRERSRARARDRESALKRKLKRVTEKETRSADDRERREERE